MSTLLDCAHPWVRSLHAYEPGKPIEDVAREIGFTPEQIIKLASNENPLGPSKKALQAMQNAASEMHVYPDGGGWELRNALAEKFALTKDHVVLGNGSNEIIELLGHCFSQPGKKTVASEYAFVVYKLMTQLFGGEFVEVPAQKFGHDLVAMAEACQDPSVTQVFVANPNNPTGTFVDQNAIDQFVTAVPESVVIVFDEAYHEVSNSPVDVIKFVQEGRKNVVVQRTFSKILGLAGLRIGYGLAHPELANVLQKARQPFNVNAMAQAAAIAALEDEAHISATKTMNQAGLEFWYQALEEQQLEYLPSEGNFIMVRVSGYQKNVNVDANSLFQAMLEQGVIIRSLASYQLPDWIRITIGTEAQNKRCLEALLQAIGKATN